MVARFVRWDAAPALSPQVTPAQLASMATTSTLPTASPARYLASTASAPLVASLALLGTS